MLDWKLARRIALQVAGRPRRPAMLPGDLDAICEQARERVVAYTRLEPAAPLPRPEAVDRPAWLDANLDGLRSTLDPIVERLDRGTAAAGPLAGPLRSSGEMLLAAETGALTGYLAQRVLGQYELRLLEPDTPARLLFVAPNIHDAARHLDADLEELLTWIAFHEVTHAVQFGGVTWLRAHVAAMLSELLDSLDVRFDPAAALRLPSTTDLRELVERVREGGLLTAVVGAERKELLDRVQATMALIEGHAEHVMDAVGHEVLPNLDALRAALDRRRRERPLAFRLLERLIGLDLKVRQYQEGKRFCDAIVDRAGVAALHLAFESPEMLPTSGELADPAAWLARVRPAA
jgi:coenzyme F420 biosynthesis associated uncharacterized protein